MRCSLLSAGSFTELADKVFTGELRCVRRAVCPRLLPHLPLTVFPLLTYLHPGLPAPAHLPAPPHLPAATAWG